jgi:hypothetical protein
VRVGHQLDEGGVGVAPIEDRLPAYAGRSRRAQDDPALRELSQEGDLREDGPRGLLLGWEADDVVAAERQELLAGQLRRRARSVTLAASVSHWAPGPITSFTPATDPVGLGLVAAWSLVTGRAADRLRAARWSGLEVTMSDTTEFVIRSSGKLYPAAVLDLFSRFIVGWAVSAAMARYSGSGGRRLSVIDLTCPRLNPGTELLAFCGSGVSFIRTLTETFRLLGGIASAMSASFGLAVRYWRGKSRPKFSSESFEPAEVMIRLRTARRPAAARPVPNRRIVEGSGTGAGSMGSVG